jgi:hypothetical protein
MEDPAGGQPWATEKQVKQRGVELECQSACLVEGRHSGGEDGSHRPLGERSRPHCHHSCVGRHGGMQMGDQTVRPSPAPPALEQLPRQSELRGSLHEPSEASSPSPKSFPLQSLREVDDTRIGEEPWT